MTIFLAAILGNVLAWLVHVAAWRLREKRLSLIACLGVPCVLLYLVVWPLTIISALQRGWLKPSFVLFGLLLFSAIAPTACGLWQFKFLQSQNCRSRRVAILAFFAEATFGTLFCLVASETVELYQIDFFRTSYPIGNNWYSTKQFCVVAFCVTLFGLAVSRPLVVRFWDAVRPQRTQPKE